LERISFDPSEGITRHFTGQDVKIVSRNLNAEIRPNVRLLDGLCRHRVPWIKEADETTLLAANNRATIVESLDMR
jgi:hypothetical protein